MDAALTGFFQNWWPEILASILSLVIGTWIGRWRAWRAWAGRHFFDRVNVSLNFVEDGDFRIRTLLERNCTEVFRNAEMVRAVMTAARRTNGESALLPLKKKDYWYYLNAMLNAISEHFSEGFLRFEAGMGARPQTYLLCLTSEDGRDVRQRKLRAMLVREDLLRQSGSLQPRFKNKFHEARWETLRQICQEWEESKGKTERIREISICL